MEELIFTSSDGKYIAEFTSGSINLLQYAASQQPKTISIYCRIDDSLEWVMLCSFAKPPIASIWSLDIPQDINVRIVSDTPFDSAVVRTA